MAGMNDRRAITSEGPADLRHGQAEADMGEVHGDLAGKGCRAGRDRRSLTARPGSAVGEPAQGCRDDRLGDIARHLRIAGGRSGGGYGRSRLERRGRAVRRDRG
jgi:hypothetical protein